MQKPRGSVRRNVHPLGVLSPAGTPGSRRTRSPGRSPVPPLGGASPVGELPRSQYEKCRSARPGSQALRLSSFRDHQSGFREPPKTATSHQPPARFQVSGSKQPEIGGCETSAQTREAPRERPPKHPPSRGSLPKPAFADSSFRDPKVTDSDSDRSPYRRWFFPRPKPGSETLPLPNRSPVKAARPLRSGPPRCRGDPHMNDRVIPKVLSSVVPLREPHLRETGPPFR